MMADDFTPYYARREDIVNEEKFVRGTESGVVELPVAWELDDYPYFHWSSRPLNPGLRETDEVLRIWLAEFEFCRTQVRSGVLTLTTHPEIIGRGPRIQMLDTFIGHAKSQKDVAICTAAEAAEAWRHS
jgi:hypothetical protein